MTIFIELHNSQQHNYDTTPTMIQQTFQTILNKSHATINHIAFMTPFSIIRIIQHEQVNSPPILITLKHILHTVNKDLEIHLPQITEQSLRDLSLSFSLNFQIDSQ